MPSNVPLSGTSTMRKPFVFSGFCYRGPKNFPTANIGAKFWCNPKCFSLNCGQMLALTVLVVIDLVCARLTQTAIGTVLGTQLFFLEVVSGKTFFKRDVHAESDIDSPVINMWQKQTYKLSLQLNPCVV